MSRRIAIIIGAGPGLGSSIARALLPTHSLVLLSRSLPGSLPKLGLGQVSDDTVLACSSDGSRDTLDAAVEQMKKKWPEGTVDVGVFNTGGAAWSPGGFLDQKIDDLKANVDNNIYAAFNFSQTILPLILDSEPNPTTKGRGTLLFTGATMSLRGGAKFSAMAPPMFARRALAQSLAREFGPKGVHVAHIVVDGQIETERVQKMSQVTDTEDKRLHPDDLAQTYLALINQPRSTWTQELDIRPYCETF
ncbi:hypothetical protein BCR39DRAFT_152090 [Naematelia encephala]|uniref:Short-chain dehydrogenase/reductase SDR n=1 Tax=Naematelia encephala TaxID=71784 RepID=A0A1Y2B7E8_9TREE|nr:hypothetical protein BCR39DRAFT_152090 [Naematelia encephala]